MGCHKQEKIKLQNIQALLTRAEELYGELNQETKEYSMNSHEEKHTLLHCLRWGLMAIDDIRMDYDNELA